MDWNYNLWNTPYIKQNAIQQNDINQDVEIKKSVKALKDFLDSTKKIQPQFREKAMGEYCAILLEYFYNN